MSATADVLSKERDAKFKIWLQNKSLKEKAFEVISHLILFNMITFYTIYDHASIWAS